MQHYVLGLMFDPSGSRVLLIRKNRPTWQAGRLNGIGGKVEPGESPLAAMVREFAEETGLATSMHGWRHFGMLEGEDFQVWCFACNSPHWHHAASLTDEKVEDLPCCGAGLACIAMEGVSNLLTLVAHAGDPDGAFLQLAYRALGAERAWSYDIHAGLGTRA